MNIRINETPVDFTLELEKTFADLYRSLRQWAQSEQLELLSVLGDGKALHIDDTTALDSIETVEVEAVPASEGTLAHLAVVSRFFLLAADATDPELPDLHSQYLAIRPVLETLLGQVVHRLSSELAVLDGSWSAPGVGEAAFRVAAEAAALYSELDNPSAALAETISQLEQALPGDELAQLFQKGHDRDGFRRILDLFTIFENLSRRADLALERSKTDSGAWTGFQDELRPFLGEARDALEAGDHILLTDLLEYEIVPRLSAVRGCFSNLDPAGLRT
jgi:hypothetical protein